MEECLTCCKSYRLPFIVNTIYGVVCVQLAHFSLGDWKDISFAHVIIIIKSEVSTIPIVIIFFRGCVPEMFVHILSLSIHTFRENRDFVFIIIVQFMMSSNSRMRSGLQIVYFCLCITSYHYHHCAIFFWRHWTFTMPVRYILSSVWVRLSIFSQLSIIQYMWLCDFSLPISLVLTERINTLSYYHHQIGSMNYHPLFRVRSWNNGMCYMCLYIPKSRADQLKVLTTVMTFIILMMMILYLFSFLSDPPPPPPHPTPHPTPTPLTRSKSSFTAFTPPLFPFWLHSFISSFLTKHVIKPYIHTAYIQINRGVYIEQ